MNKYLIFTLTKALIYVDNDVFSSSLNDFKQDGYHAALVSETSHRCLDAVPAIGEGAAYDVLLLKDMDWSRRRLDGYLDGFAGLADPLYVIFHENTPLRKPVQTYLKQRAFAFIRQHHTSGSVYADELTTLIKASNQTEMYQLALQQLANRFAGSLSEAKITLIKHLTLLRWDLEKGHPVNLKDEISKLEQLPVVNAHQQALSGWDVFAQQATVGNFADALAQLHQQLFPGL